MSTSFLIGKIERGATQAVAHNLQASGSICKWWLFVMNLKHHAFKQFNKTVSAELRRRLED
jgi:hypothetical protein